MTVLKTSTVVALHVVRHKCSQSAKKFPSPTFHATSIGQREDSLSCFLSKTGMGWTCHLIE